MEDLDFSTGAERRLRRMTRRTTAAIRLLREELWEEALQVLEDGFAEDADSILVAEAEADPVVVRARQQAKSDLPPGVRLADDCLEFRSGWRSWFVLAIDETLPPELREVRSVGRDARDAFDQLRHYVTDARTRANSAERVTDASEVDNEA